MPLLQAAEQVPCKYLDEQIQKQILQLGSPVFFFFFLFMATLQHMEVPRLGIELELQLLTHSTATATSDLRHVCDLLHSSWQHQILNPLIEARDQTLILMDTSRIHYL